MSLKTDIEAVVIDAAAQAAGFEHGANLKDLQASAVLKAEELANVLTEMVKFVPVGNAAIAAINAIKADVA